MSGLAEIHVTIDKTVTNTKDKGGDHDTAHSNAYLMLYKKFSPMVAEVYDGYIGDVVVDKYNLK